MERVTYISAGAGSGKTYTLTHLLANHIANGDVEPEKVILTTYTKKAAAEFREKAKSVLYEEGRTNPMLYEAAARLEQASIGTVHAVANSFVQKYWYYLGLSPQQKVIAEEDVNFYISQSLAELPTEEEIKFLNKFRYQFSIEKLRDPGNPAMGSYADYGFWKDLLVQVIKKSETFGVNDLAESRQKSLDLVRRLYHGNMAMPTAKDITEVIPELLEAIKKATFRTEETRETVKESISKFESVPQILSFLWIKDFKEALSSVVHIGHLVHAFELLHDHLAQGGRRYLGIQGIVHFPHDTLHHLVLHVRGDGPFFTGFADTRSDLFPFKRFSTPIPLDHHDGVLLYPFEGGEPAAALYALPPTTNGRAVLVGATVDDLALHAAAVTTLHWLVLRWHSFVHMEYTIFSLPPSQGIL